MHGISQLRRGSSGRSAPFTHPLTVVCAACFLVVIWHSHDPCYEGFGVRDGSGVSAPVSSRLYHTQMQVAR
jgi:hypothetical protein